MFLASTAAWAGSLFTLLTMRISDRALHRSLREPTSAKKCQQSGTGKIPRRCSKLFGAKDTIAGRLMASSVPEPERAFKEFRTLRI